VKYFFEWSRHQNNLFCYFKRAQIELQFDHYAHLELMFLYKRPLKHNYLLLILFLKKEVMKNREVDLKKNYEFYINLISNTRIYNKN